MLPKLTSTERYALSMTTLAAVETQLGMVPAQLTTMLRAIDQAQGREHVSRQQHPDVLAALTTAARIQSPEASNPIQDSKAPPARIPPSSR